MSELGVFEKLNNTWKVYITSKFHFKTLLNGTVKEETNLKPYTEFFNMKTCNDLFYLLKFMKTKKVVEDRYKKTPYNLFSNGYAIMKDDILPVWEDEENKYGGTYSIQVTEKNIFNVWEAIMFHMVANDLTSHPECINGISTQYIINSKGGDNFIIIKIWDKYRNFDRDLFYRELSDPIKDIVKNCSIQYKLNRDKKEYNDNNVPDIINNAKNNNKLTKVVKKKYY